ncbi:fungal hydrophobin [Phlegmacium glaucopus]|nr:fungal hydrophobin [Phlegmacium glaucopus]
MFARAASVFVLALALLATATVLPRDECSSGTGSLQCCNSVQSATANTIAILANMGITEVPNENSLVGFTCSPITAGVSGTSCSEESVCCTGNSFNGAVVLGCTPINA